MRGWALAALLCAGGMGCGGGGDGGGGPTVFTLTVELPAASSPADPLQVLVQARPETFPFEEQWAIEPSDEPAAPLEPERSSRELVLPREDLGDGTTTDVHVKIRFCEDAMCDTEHSARWLLIERAYHPGAQTAYTDRIESIPARTPTGSLGVDPCEIRGCEDIRPDDDPDYCNPEGGHYCSELTEDK